MKRTPFKPRKTPLRASQGLRKASKQPISKLQRELWEECKRIVRARYPNRCFTCDAPDLAKSNWQTGHGPWPKSVLGAFLKYDLRCLRPQCGVCNLRRGGMGGEFYKRLLTEIGPEGMEQLEKDRLVSVKAADHYEKILRLYRTL